MTRPTAPHKAAPAPRSRVGEIKAAEKGAADEAAERTAKRAVAEFAQRPGRHAFADADGRAKTHPAQAARHDGSRESGRRAGAEALDQRKVDPFAEGHAKGAAQCAQEDAIGRQADEAQQRAVAQRLDADDEIADGAADDGAAEQQIEPESRLRRVGGVGIGEDAKEHPAEQTAQGAEHGVEINARQKGHHCHPEEARRVWVPPMICNGRSGRLQRTNRRPTCHFTFNASILAFSARFSCSTLTNGSSPVSPHIGRYACRFSSSPTAASTSPVSFFFWSSETFLFAFWFSSVPSKSPTTLPTTPCTTVGRWYSAFFREMSGSRPEPEAVTMSAGDLLEILERIELLRLRLLRQPCIEERGLHVGVLGVRLDDLRRRAVHELARSERRPVLGVLVVVREEEGREVVVLGSSLSGFASFHFLTMFGWPFAQAMILVFTSAAASSVGHLPKNSFS